MNVEFSRCCSPEKRRLRALREAWCSVAPDVAFWSLFLVWPVLAQGLSRCAGAWRGPTRRRSSSRSSTSTQARHPLPLDSLIDGNSFFLLNTRVSKGRSRGLSFRSLPPWYTGVFASLAPKSVWRGVNTSSRFFGVADHASSVVIPFCAILFLGSLVSILPSTVAPGMREGTLLLP